MTRDEMVKQMAELGNQEVSAAFLAEYDALAAKNTAIEAEKAKLVEERAKLRETNQKLFLRVSQPGADGADKHEGSGPAGDSHATVSLTDMINRAKGVA